MIALSNSSDTTGVEGQATNAANTSSDVGEAQWFPIEDIPWKEFHTDTEILLEKALGVTSPPE